VQVDFLQVYNPCISSAKFFHPIITLHIPDSNSGTWRESCIYWYLKLGPRPSQDEPWYYGNKNRSRCGRTWTQCKVCAFYWHIPWNVSLWL